MIFVVNHLDSKAMIEPHGMIQSWYTLTVDGWAVTFGTARRGLGGCYPAQSPPHCTKCNSPPISGQCTNHCIAIWWSVALPTQDHYLAPATAGEVVILVSVFLSFSVYDLTQIAMKLDQ